MTKLWRRGHFSSSGHKLKLVNLIFQSKTAVSFPSQLSGGGMSGGEREDVGESGWCVGTCVGVSV